MNKALQESHCCISLSTYYMALKKKSIRNYFLYQTF